MPSDSDRLLGAGHDITFLDGSVHGVRFAMRGLKMIEDEFGSLQALPESIGTKEIGSIVKLIAAGLCHEKWTPDALLDELDPRRFAEYSEAVLAALNEALPDTVKSADADPTTAAAPSQPPSPGPTSTTSPPFVMAGATATSGN